MFFKLEQKVRILIKQRIFKEIEGTEYTRVIEIVFIYFIYLFIIIISSKMLTDQ
jgi:hypothetical protein